MSLEKSLARKTEDPLTPLAHDLSALLEMVASTEHEKYTLKKIAELEVRGEKDKAQSLLNNYLKIYKNKEKNRKDIESTIKDFLEEKKEVIEAIKTQINKKPDTDDTLTLKSAKPQPVPVTEKGGNKPQLEIDKSVINDKKSNKNSKSVKSEKRTYNFHVVHIHGEDWKAEKFSDGKVLYRSDSGKLRQVLFNENEDTMIEELTQRVGVSIEPNEESTQEENNQTIMENKKTEKSKDPEKNSSLDWLKKMKPVSKGTPEPEIPDAPLPATTKTKTSEPTASTPEAKKEYVPLHKRIEQILQEENGKKILEILSKKGLIVATHGKNYTFRQDFLPEVEGSNSTNKGDEGLSAQTDLDGQLSGYLLSQAGISINQQDFIEAGTKDPSTEASEKNADIYFDAEESGEILSIRKDEKTGKEYIAFGNHYADRQEKTSSAEIFSILVEKASKLEKRFKDDKNISEMLKGFKKLKNNEALREFIRFNNDTDNLLVPKEINSDYKNQLPITLYGLYRDLPFDDIKAHFESGKKATDPIDDAVLNRKVTVGSNGKTKEITLKQRVIERINGSELGIKKAQKEMADNFYIGETPELGRLLINDRKTSNITMKEIARFKGYTSTITLGDEGAFISCPGRNIEAYGKELKEKFPEMILVNSMLIYRPKETKFDRQEFLEALNLIDKNEKFKATLEAGKKFQNKEGQILTIEKINGENFTYMIDGVQATQPELIEAFREQCENGEWTTELKNDENTAHSLRENMRNKFTAKFPEGYGYPEDVYNILTEEEITQKNIAKQEYNLINDEPIYKGRVNDKKIEILQGEVALEKIEREKEKEAQRKRKERLAEIDKLLEEDALITKLKNASETNEKKDSQVEENISAETQNTKAIEDEGYMILSKKSPAEFPKLFSEMEKLREEKIKELETKRQEEMDEKEASKIAEEIEQIKEAQKYINEIISLPESQDKLNDLLGYLEDDLKENKLDQANRDRLDIQEYLLNPMRVIETAIERTKARINKNPSDIYAPATMKFYIGLRDKILDVLKTKKPVEGKKFTL